jgi:hypothetical protein
MQDSMASLDWKRSLANLKPDVEDAARRFPDLRMVFIREGAMNVEGGLSYPDYGPREQDIGRFPAYREPIVKLYWSYKDGEVFDHVRFYGERPWVDRFMELAQVGGNCLPEDIPWLSVPARNWKPDEPEILWILAILSLAWQKRKGTLFHARKRDAWIQFDVELFHSILPLSPFLASVELIDVLLEEEGERAEQRGVSMFDAAMILSEGDPQAARESVARWQRLRSPKPPPEIGKCPRHKQRKLYAPAALCDFIEKVEGERICQENRLRQRLREKARAARQE